MVLSVQKKIIVVIFLEASNEITKPLQRITVLVQITQLLDFSLTTAIIQVLNQQSSITLLI